MSLFNFLALLELQYAHVSAFTQYDEDGYPVDDYEDEGDDEGDDDYYEDDGFDDDDETEWE
ncbi:MAG: hypothetical protein MRY57_03410 [Candidatus Pacebacteria bacterium]|nr:hypothetical protein [Candidatus Paceibacterota bacterium]